MYKDIDQKGFTLVEVLLALAISSIVISGFFSLVWTTTKAYENGISFSDNQYMARRAITDIEKDIKAAYSVEIPTEAELFLNKKSKGKRNAEIRYRINKENDNLLRNSIPIAENLKRLEFKQNRDTNGLVEVKVEVEYKGEKYSLSTSVFPHNARP
ncbi:MAG TPA: prepilin-type N-terminal cleavage/methylation domain-containing protein [Syntrophomonadaceae bacterium]|nr:prepilin-type N-terminal cleavage/methylation domain-containing protein [Syntrophomonadaceae bacterium]